MIKNLLNKFLGSKTSFIFTLIITIVLLILCGIGYFKYSGLEKKVGCLEKDLDERDAVIVELRDEIKVKDIEILYLRKGMNIAREYETEKQKAVENGTATKVEVLQTVMSNEESQDWWNTPIPDDVLSLLTCH